ncbi:MAG TPA: hypothetical protein VFZ51_06465, partial [Woeseiaceae bacterium]
MLQSASEKAHLYAGQLQNIIVGEFSRLRAYRLAIHQGIVSFFTTFNVHDKVTFGATRDSGNLDAGASER